MRVFLQKLKVPNRGRGLGHLHHNLCSGACMHLQSSSISHITRPSEHQQVIKHSKFIALATPIASAREAMRCVEAARSAHPKATHHCWAFSISGNGASGSSNVCVNAEAEGEADAETGVSVSRHSDDGEPSGTAGRPILTAIESESVVDVVVVVTRYFGGVQLGTGGLSRAYGSAARVALQLADKRTAVDIARITVRLPAGSCPDGTELDREMLHAVYACMQRMNSHSSSRTLSSSKLDTQSTNSDSISISKISEALEVSPSTLAAGKEAAHEAQSRSALVGYEHASEWQCPRDAVPLLHARLHDATRGLAVLTVT